MSAVRPPARSELEANPDSGFAQSSGRTALLQSPRRGEPPCSRIGHLQPAVSQTATMTPREPDSATDFEPCFAAIDSTPGDHELIGRCASLHRDPCLPAEAAPMPGIDPPEAYCSSRQVLSLCPGSSKLERHENRQKRTAGAPVSFQICSAAAVGDEPGPRVPFGGNFRAGRCACGHILRSAPLILHDSE